MPRSEFSEMIQRAHGMVGYVRENLTVQELDLFLDEIAPLPEPVETEPKKAGKKRGRKASKSRAPIAEKIAETMGTTGCAKCDHFADHNVHHMTSAVGYHEFVPVVAKAASGG